MMRLLLLTALLAASGTASLATPAQSPNEPWHARGNGPSWSLTITDGRMTNESPGQPSVSVATPSAQNPDSILHYQSPALSVRIFPIACTDELSGRRYPDSVFVTVGQQEREGCGGAALPADSLNGTSWLFVEISGEPVELTGDLPADDSYRIYFGAYVFAGVGGCTRFSADYSRKGDTLTMSGINGDSTRLCGDAIWGSERRLMEILSEPVSISFPDAKSLVLSGDKGTIKLLRTETDE